MPLPRINAVNTVERLRQRLACNQASDRSFPDFVLDVLAPRADDVALDLGCGLGAQLLPLAQLTQSIVGVDVSGSMVTELRRHAGTGTRIIEGDMDDIEQLELGEPFTLIYAVYSLYYSRDPSLVVRRAGAALAGERARFVTVNPDVGNNEAWFADLSRLFELPADAVDVPNVARRVILPACRETFAAVECQTFEDRKRFPTLDALMAYYDACAPYCRPEKRDAARRYFGEKLERDGAYEIVKRSLAIVGTGVHPPAGPGGAPR